MKKKERLKQRKKREWKHTDENGTEKSDGSKERRKDGKEREERGQQNDEGEKQGSREYQNHVQWL